MNSYFLIVALSVTLVVTGVGCGNQANKIESGSFASSLGISGLPSTPVNPVNPISTPAPTPVPVSTPSPTPVPTPAPLACSFNGQSVASGSSVMAYQSSSVPFGSSCASQSRTCSNGILGGSYTAASCAVAAPAACSFNGQSVSSGNSVTAYQSGSVPFGSVCVSQSRSCTNGSLSGSYTFGSCAVGQPASCNFNGQTVASGSSILAYTQQSVPNGSSCSYFQQNITCTNGSFPPGTFYPSCAANCTFNGQSVTSGSSVTAFQALSVPYGSSCVSQTRTCSNGTMSGSYSYPSCSVASPTPTPTPIPAPTINSFNSSATSILLGQSITLAWSTSNVSNVQIYFGSTLLINSSLASGTITHIPPLTGSLGYQLTATGSNGTTIYSFINITVSNPVPTPAPTPAASCIYNGQTYASGQSFTVYTAQTVPYGSSCSSVAETITCNNGSLPSGTYYSSCTSEVPVTGTCVGYIGVGGSFSLSAPKFQTTFTDSFTKVIAECNQYFVNMNVTYCQQVGKTNCASMIMTIINGVAYNTAPTGQYATNNLYGTYPSRELSNYAPATSPAPAGTIGGNCAFTISGKGFSEVATGIFSTNITGTSDSALTSACNAIINSNLTNDSSVSPSVSHETLLDYSTNQDLVNF